MFKGNCLVEEIKTYGRKMAQICSKNHDFFGIYLNMENSSKGIISSNLSKKEEKENSTQVHPDTESEELRVNPPARLLTDRQRHVLIGLIGLCLVILMSFSLLMLLSILKEWLESHIIFSLILSPIDIIMIAIAIWSGLLVISFATTKGGILLIFRNEDEWSERCAFVWTITKWLIFWQAAPAIFILFAGN